MSGVRRPAGVGHHCSSGVAAAAGRRGLRPALVTGRLHDRRHLVVGDEALPTLFVPVEEHPDPVALVRVSEDLRAFRSVLPTLVGALRREDLHEAVELLHLRRCEDQRMPPSIDRISMRSHSARAHRANALCGGNEVVLEGPDRRGCATANARLLVDVLDVMPHGLRRDAEVGGDLLVGRASDEHE